jgi:hypothetical protein
MNYHIKAKTWIGFVHIPPHMDCREQPNGYVISCATPELRKELKNAFTKPVGIQLKVVK